jgi:hypothetical protein
MSSLLSICKYLHWNFGPVTMITICVSVVQLSVLILDCILTFEICIIHFGDNPSGLRRTGQHFGTPCTGLDYNLLRLKGLAGIIFGQPPRASIIHHRPGQGNNKRMAWIFQNRSTEPGSILGFPGKTIYTRS